MIQHNVTVTCDASGRPIQPGEEYVQVSRFTNGGMTESLQYRADELQGLPFPTPADGEAIQIGRGTV